MYLFGNWTADDVAEQAISDMEECFQKEWGLPTSLHIFDDYFSVGDSDVSVSFTEQGVPRNTFESFLVGLAWIKFHSGIWRFPDPPERPAVWKAYRHAFCSHEPARKLAKQLWDQCLDSPFLISEGVRQFSLPKEQRATRAITIVRV